MSAVTQQGADSYRIDFTALRRGLWKKLTGAPVVVDPHLVATGIIEVMRACSMQSARGKSLVWNEYRLFLSRADQQVLRPLEEQLGRDLDVLLREELVDRGAEVVGDLMVRLLVDESSDLPQGQAVVRVAFVPTAQLAEPGDGEVTIRVGHKDLAAPATTQRVCEPASEGELCLSWPGGSTSVGQGVRVVVGRPHADASPGFVPLTGAGTRINKRHAWIEASAGGAIIGRLSSANPVQVNGRLVQPGGKLAIDSFPAEISLSSGELLLRITRSEGA